MLSNHLGEIDNRLSELDKNQNITPELVNNVVNDLGIMFTQSASSVLGNSNTRQFKSNHSNKPWFDKNCREKRNAFHEVRAKYRYDKSDNVRASLNARSREFKKQMTDSFNKYTKKCANELRNYSKSDSKQFWKILNKFSKCKKENPDISTETFFEYFKNLNSDDLESDSSDDIVIDIDAVIENNPLYDEILNGSITEKEVTEAINKLKSSKAPGNDSILNEYIKNTPQAFIPLYCKLFNIVLNTGIIPDSWLLGIIKPMYKNKGNPQDPDNFRAITLISCLGKLFTSVINERLNFFSNELELISKNQAGFRKGHSTADNIFVLYALISLYLSFGKKLFCTFIDFRKAFDTVWRKGLWFKLQKSQIKG